MDVRKLILAGVIGIMSLWALPAIAEHQCTKAECGTSLSAVGGEEVGNGYQDGDTSGSVESSRTLEGGKEGGGRHDGDVDELQGVDGITGTEVVNG
jgi:hypothetical protein